MPNGAVSGELRSVEREIDAHHLSNPLFQHPFSVAAWWFLTICEEHMVREMFRPSETGKHNWDSIANNVVMHAKWPLRWLTQACPQGSRVPREYDADLYKAAWQLSKHSYEYLAFESAFVEATMGLLTLSLDENRIKVTGRMSDESRFQAYDLLTKSSNVPYYEQPGYFFERVAASVRVKGDWFDYDLNPQMVQVGLEAFGPILDERFVLPSSWQLPHFTMGQFERVARILYVLAHLHFRARITAAKIGCTGLGVARALIIMDHSELVGRLCRYTDLPQDVVATIVGDLTYGARGQSNPDPALQPIVPLSASTVAMSPNLLINSSMERNLAVLQNRLPDGRVAYTALSQDKERLSRENIIEALTPMGFRFWHGNVPLWGGASQIDLVIVSDAEQQCLILELKSFIAPADPREVRDRSSDIRVGIEQIQARVRMAHNDPSSLRTILGINDRYLLTWAVASDTSIGAGYVQSTDVPVVKTSHLIAKCFQNPLLANCCHWLENRDYLPKEGVHYRKVELERVAGGWTLEWHGIECLVDDYV